MMWIIALRLSPSRRLDSCESLRMCSSARRELSKPLGLLGQAAAVLLVVGEDVEHRLALVGEPLVGLVEVAHDVQHRAAPLLAPGARGSRASSTCCWRCSGSGSAGAYASPFRQRRQRLGLGRHQFVELSRLVLATSAWRLSSSFSSAIIFSSRPTTTSSNFSRSRIFSCSSVFDCSRSRTTSS